MTCKSKTKAFFLNETFRLSFSIVLKSSLNKKVKHKGQSVGLCFYKCINYMANFPMLNRYSTTHDAYNDEAQSEFFKDSNHQFVIKPSERVLPFLCR